MLVAEATEKLHSRAVVASNRFIGMEEERLLGLGKGIEKEFENKRVNGRPRSVSLYVFCIESCVNPAEVVSRGTPISACNPVHLFSQRQTTDLQIREAFAQKFDIHRIVDRS